MRRLWKLAALTGLAVSTALAGGVTAASAAPPTPPTPPAGYGFDGTAHTLFLGGSDTTYQAMKGLSDVWNEQFPAGCIKDNTTQSSVNNQCKNPADPANNKNLNNWDGDTVANGSATGSSAGISSLNGFQGVPTGGEIDGRGASYQGAIHANPTASAAYPCVDNTGGSVNVDMARSSRSLNTTGGAIIAGSGFGGAPCNRDETKGDTGWGFAQDGVTVVGFGARGGLLNSGAGLTPDQIFGIFNGTITNWSSIPGAGAAGPIVAWGQNASSGTFGTMNTWVCGHVTVACPSGWTVNTNGGASPNADRKLSTGTEPLENDIKPLLNNQALDNGASSVNNPENWVWFSSFGVFSAFPFTSSENVLVSGSPTQITAIPSAINGQLPNGQNILCNPPACTVPWTIQRVLYHVTRKGDADCPHTTPGDITTDCTFTDAGQLGPSLAGTVGTAANDLNVTGGTSGNAGAIREFTRFLCRVSAGQQGVDPYSGVNNFLMINSAISAAGFTVVSNTNKTAGSRCKVVTH